MKFYTFLLLNLITLSQYFILYPMGDYQHDSFELASEQDIDKITNIIDNDARHDSQKIVILPKKFQKDILQKNIENGKLFVAKNNNSILGYKKLFVLENEEKHDVLVNEIRCTAEPVYQAKIYENLEFIDSQDNLVINPDSSNNLIIYTGGDYTLPQFRGCGINSKLMDYSLSLIKPEILEKLRDNKIIFLSLVYGITKYNSGQVPGDKGDRSYYIAKAFINFIKSLGFQDNIALDYARYKSFMPTFDYNSQELKPLPDEQSVPGFGCILTYKLNN